MNIKKILYKVHNGNSFDTYYFGTSGDMVHVLDKDNNVLGSISDYLLDGKVITAGAVKDLKTTGLYLTKGLAGLPSGVSSTSEILIEVHAIQDKVYTYRVFNTDGAIYDKIVIGTSDKGWSSGGTKVQESIQTLIDNFGALSQLKTGNKDSIVSAINSVLDYAKDIEKSVRTGSQDLGEYKGHNHDNRYMRKDTDSSLNGAIKLGVGSGIKLDTAREENVISANSNNDIVLGNRSSNLAIHTKGAFTHNGGKIWTEANHGAGSGLDADKLGGSPSSDYARKDGSNTFTQQQAFNERVVAKKGIDLNGGIMSLNANNELNVTLKGKSVMTLTESGALFINRGEITGDATDATLRLKQNGNSAGIGLNVSRSNGDMLLYNWESNAAVMKVPKNSTSAEFLNHLVIQGKNLYLQPSMPTGSHPVGSVWISA